jgi:hypothetical protein
MRSTFPQKQEYLYNLNSDPYEQNNLAIKEVAVKNLLNKKLDEHVESMPKTKWPQSVFMPVTIDKPVTEYKDGDELIYWPN